MRVQPDRSREQSNGSSSLRSSGTATALVDEEEGVARPYDPLSAEIFEFLRPDGQAELARLSADRAAGAIATGRRPVVSEKARRVSTRRANAMTSLLVNLCLAAVGAGIAWTVYVDHVNPKVWYTAAATRNALFLDRQTVLKSPSCRSDIAADACFSSFSTTGISREQIAQLDVAGSKLAGQARTPLLGAAAYLALMALITLGRRLHDFGSSAWHLLELAVPVWGIYRLLAFTFHPGDLSTNAFGPPPLPSTSWRAFVGARPIGWY